MAENGEQKMEEVKEQEVAPAPTAGSPADFLKSVVGSMVSVRLNSGVDYRGKVLLPSLLLLPLLLLL